MLSGKTIQRKKLYNRIIFKQKKDFLAYQLTNETILHEAKNFSQLKKGKQ